MMKHPSSSKYDYSDNVKFTPWYVRLWCRLFHSNKPMVYNARTKTIRCLKCGTEFK